MVNNLEIHHRQFSNFFKETFFLWLDQKHSLDFQSIYKFSLHDYGLEDLPLEKTNELQIWFEHLYNHKWIEELFNRFGKFREIIIHSMNSLTVFDLEQRNASINIPLNESEFQRALEILSRKGQQT